MAKDELIPKPTKPDNALAAELVRQKIEQIYSKEPSAESELADAKKSGQHSKHQQFMLELSKSGRSLAEIQTAWHNYYVGLPDNEKHEVWQEFYIQHGQKKQQPPVTKKVPSQTASDIKKHLLQAVSSRGKLARKHHFRSLFVGLAAGGAVVLLLSFTFFNERFIAPFITPSRSVSSTPIILDPAGTTAPANETKLIIPKINVEVPLVYGGQSIEEKDVQKALEGGVLHYAITPLPGEKGNSVIVGHSSNNILNTGKYKFVFVLLNRLQPGDTFSINRDGKRYTYKVYDKRVIKPDDLSVLGDTGKPASVSLITCDPPGTSINRLVVVGEQISPDPTGNLASSAKPADERPQIIPGNAPSLWQRIINFFSG